MLNAFTTALGGALILAAWLLPRHVAAARLRLAAALPLDAAPFIVGGALLLLTTGRPVFGGIVVFALGAGFALADWTMRETLREPAVFSEIVELPQVFTHPQLYLPFAGPGLVIGGAVMAVLAGIALLVFEPPVVAPRPVLGLLCDLAILGAVWIISREPALGAVAASMRRLKPSGEPFADSATLGPMAMQLVHCAIARAERTARRAAVPAPALLRSAQGPARPVVLVQCESFFDARRLSPAIPADMLAGFERARRSAAMFGRLEVPGWGANTMRAEFAVLSGIPETALGYDRFNPYYAFARKPLGSQVWRLRQAGYRTICVHPFDRRFFRRDLAMPALGFDRFLGLETLGGSRRPPYCSDLELAEHILRLLESEGSRSFIFAITMGNHGPWLDMHASGSASTAAFGGIPQGSELLRYLDGLRGSDRMLARLMEGLAEREDDPILAFYGDHLPSLPRAFDHFGFAEPHSDYVIWPRGESPPLRRDLPSHRLGATIVDMLLLGAGRSGTARSAGGREPVVAAVEARG